VIWELLVGSTWFEAVSRPGTPAEKARIVPPGSYNMSDSEPEQVTDKSASEVPQPIAELARQILLAMEQQRAGSKPGRSDPSTSKGKLVIVAISRSYQPYVSTSARSVKSYVGIASR